MSDIVFNTINENFPVAGQDNDTQVFRDNFNSIKTALSTARTEITDLENKTGGLSATEELEGLTLIGSNFNNQVIYQAVLQGSWERKLDQGSRNVETQFSFLEASYHIVKFTGDVDLGFQEFLNTTGPVASQGVAKITLELYGDETERTLTFKSSGSTQFRKNSLGIWGGTALNPTITVTSDTNPVFVEVWQHNNNVIFLNYVGQFI